MSNGTMATQLHISLSRQRLWLLDSQEVLAEWPISTARNGAGERMGSECTPRGWHRIRAMIGGECPPGTVFVGRRPTGECYTPELGKAFPDRDWILTRILWLSGMEPGLNRLGEVDTMRRYIYIHGCPAECPMGVAESHGCIRMHDDALTALYAQVKPGMRVWIGDEDVRLPEWQAPPSG